MNENIDDWQNSRNQGCVAKKKFQEPAVVPDPDT